MSEKEREMSDPRERLAEVLWEKFGAEPTAPLAAWLDHQDCVRFADAILAEFDVTPRGKGTTIEIGGRRAGKTQALAERVADEVMERGGLATVTSLPSVEALADALAAEGIDPEPGELDLTPTAERLLALLPGRTEAEVKAEALRKAAPGCNCEDDYAWLNDRADRIEKEVDRDR